MVNPNPSFAHIGRSLTMRVRFGSRNKRTTADAPRAAKLTVALKYFCFFFNLSHAFARAINPFPLTRVSNLRASSPLLLNRASPPLGVSFPIPVALTRVINENLRIRGGLEVRAAFLAKGRQPSPQMGTVVTRPKGRRDLGPRTQGARARRRRSRTWFKEKTKHLAVNP